MSSIAYLEPGVGGGCQEEAGETPDGVRERRPPGEVWQRDEDPLSEHVLLVMLAGGGSEDLRRKYFKSFQMRKYFIFLPS